MAQSNDTAPEELRAAALDLARYVYPLTHEDRAFVGGLLERINRVRAAAGEEPVPFPELSPLAHHGALMARVK